MLWHQFSWRYRGWYCEKWQMWMAESKHISEESESPVEEIQENITIFFFFLCFHFLARYKGIYNFTNGHQWLKTSVNQYKTKYKVVGNHVLSLLAVCFFVIKQWGFLQSWCLGYNEIGQIFSCSDFFILLLSWILQP